MTTAERRPDSRRRGLLVVVLLAVAAIVIYRANQGGSAAGPLDGAGAPEANTPGGPAGRAPAERPGAEERPRTAGDARIERSGIELRGRVVGRDGRPVPGAFLSVNGPGAADHEARTGADGAFAVLGMIAGSHQIVVSGPQLLTHVEHVDVAETPAAQEVEIVVDRGLPLTGQVQDDELRPVAGARVTPWREGPSGEELDPRAAVTTDSSGRFQIWGAARGATFVLVERDGFAPAKGRLEASRVGVVRLTRVR